MMFHVFILSDPEAPCLQLVGFNVCVCGNGTVSVLLKQTVKYYS